MVILRATQKVLRSLPQSASDTDASDTALGDWYVNRIVVDRQPLLLLVSSKSRLAILAPAREMRSLPDRLPGMVANRLRQLDIEWTLIDAEMDAMHTVRVGRTQDRSITGQMVDFAKAIPYYLPENGWDAMTLRDAEERLGETPCGVHRRFEDVIFPRETATRLLSDTWSGIEVAH